MRLSWDSTDKFFWSGIDRGVLYTRKHPGDRYGDAVPWNGLVSVELEDRATVVHDHFDGKDLVSVSPRGAMTGAISAMTYPDEFAEMLGEDTSMPGVGFGLVEPKEFGLSYRTRITDPFGNEYYRLIIVFNISVVNEGYTFETDTDASTQSEFSWKIKTRPMTYDKIRMIFNESMPGHVSRDVIARNPFSRIILDSRLASPVVLSEIEDYLYGTPTTYPAIPELYHLVELLM